MTLIYIVANTDKTTYYFSFQKKKENSKKNVEFNNTM